MGKVQTLKLKGETYVLVERREYQRLQSLARAAVESEGPELPKTDSDGNYPAIEYARASLARKIIRRRTASSLTQAELARRAGIRSETLNRIEKGKSTPDVTTIEKLVRALDRAEAQRS